MYYTTVYLVDPSIICNGGRTQADFDAEGTGNSVSFQNGADPLTDLISIPLTQDEMLAEVGDWQQ